MNGLLLKDLLNLRPILMYMIVISTIFGAIFESSSMIIPAMILVCIVGTSFTYDRMADWDTYAVSIGVDRREIVRSKFVLALMLLSVGTVIGILLTVCCHALRGTGTDIGWLADNIMFAVGAGLITCAVSCTASYAATPERAVAVSGTISSLFVATAVALSSIIGYNEVSVPEIVPYLVLAIGVMALVSGYTASRRIFLKKDL